MIQNGKEILMRVIMRVITPLCENIEMVTRFSDAFIVKHDLAWDDLFCKVVGAFDGTSVRMPKFQNLNQKKQAQSAEKSQHNGIRAIPYFDSCKYHTKK
ncbi:hypothetical protein HZF10_06635 [Flavobacterium sp. MAH-1]|uniref:Uncharacterized protein n=1 Tax=Flavobacterium agri TaxID=2743471 RepID=A0A7Y8Y0Z3_9FLAO|nr:hypothetical protein [Flavobacterium agri]